MSLNSLEQLKASGTVVVADTGDFEAIGKFKPQDATTNPSLLLKATQLPQYKHLLDSAIEDAKAGETLDDQVFTTNVRMSLSGSVLLLRHLFSLLLAIGDPLCCCTVFLMT